MKQTNLRIALLMVSLFAVTFLVGLKLVEPMERNPFVGTYLKSFDLQTCKENSLVLAQAIENEVNSGRITVSKAIELTIQLHQAEATCALVRATEDQ